MVATASQATKPDSGGKQPEMVFERTGKIEPALVSTLQQNPWQPRLAIDPGDLESLKQSIRDFGFLGYVPVRRANEKDPMSPLQIVYGHRRVRAAELIGHNTVPVMICRANDEAMMRLAYVENATQQKMTYWEEALHFADMQRTLNLSVRKLADMLGVSRGYVFNRLQVLSLPENSTLRRAAETSEIAMSNALALLNLSKVLDESQLDALLADVKEQRLSLDDLAALQKAVEAAVPGDEEFTDDGQRVVTATLVDQARRKVLAAPVKARPAQEAEAAPADRHQDAQWARLAERAREAEEEWNAISGDLPSASSIASGAITLKRIMETTDPAQAGVRLPAVKIDAEPVVERGPVRYISSNFATRTPHDYALQAVELLEGFVPHYRRAVERADFSTLDAAERKRLHAAVEAIQDLNRQDRDEVPSKVANGG